METRALTLTADVELDDGITADGEPRSRTFRLSPAYSGGVFSQAWAPRVVADVDGMEIDAPGGQLPALAHHDLGQWAGVIKAEDVRKLDGQLHASGELFEEGDATADMVVRKGKKATWQASIGAAVDWDSVEFVAEDETCEVNGQTFTGPLVIARKTSLHEISFTPIGADRSTSAAVFAARTQPEGVPTVADTNKPDALAAERNRVSQIATEFAADAEFMAAALKSTESIDALRLAYAKKQAAAQAEQVAALQAELEAAKAEVEKAKAAQPQISAAGIGGGSDEPPAGNVQEQLERLVRAEMKRLREDDVTLWDRPFGSRKDTLRVMALANVVQTAEGEALRAKWLQEVNS